MIQGFRNAKTKVALSQKIVLRTPILRYVLKVRCCHEELCNTQIPDYKPILNGKRCHSCEGQNCTGPINCKGDENYCFIITETLGGRSFIGKGCTSEFRCSAN
ncbi:hypothetical protein ILYODFUR_038590 [Ilyodon furcidens]|uniref:Snake toxin/toxin-like domain-containing protein n=1 Tax=Ilyodon furcidens TaxID=33524 RepID=A0ABV0UP38_9TELE